jgi:SAM-dependent methyltransferase
MKRMLADLLRCPDCGSEMALADAPPADSADVEAGTLRCVGCGTAYPIVAAIPRFVARENYSDSFGYQWTKFSKTQLDEYLGYPLSAERFRNETKWPATLPGERILEAGSGMGRFTRCAAATGAEITAIDYSAAVDANYRNNRHLPNVHFVQADIRRLPFAPESFDRVFCFGVLQHTPDPEQSFKCLLRVLKPGGQLVSDVYRKSWKTLFWGQYYLRAVTRRIPPQRLFPIVEAYFNVVHAFTGLLRPINDHFSKLVSLMLGTADYRGQYPIRQDLMREWCLLDTFDKLSPTFDRPQRLSEVRRWCDDAGLASYDVRPGYNGIEIHVRR